MGEGREDFYLFRGISRVIRGRGLGGLMNFAQSFFNTVMFLGGISCLHSVTYD